MKDRPAPVKKSWLERQPRSQTHSLTRRASACRNFHLLRPGSMPRSEAAPDSVSFQSMKDKKSRWSLPLYAKIVVALIAGVVAGLLLPAQWSEALDLPAKIILRLLGAIAPPLILLAVMRALIGANVGGNMARKLCFVLVLNTVVAILIGLAVANIIGPGRHASLPPGDAPKISGNPLAHMLDNIPGSLLAPMVDNNVIGVIMIAVAFGLAARKLKPVPKQQLLSALEIGFDLILMVLHWVITLVPLAVFCKVGFVVGTQGFKPFYALGWFIAAVLVAL